MLGRGDCLGKIFQRYTSNAVTAVAKPKQHGILIYRYTAAQHRHAEQYFCPHYAA